MTQRDMSASVLNEIGGNKVKIIHLFEGVFPDGIVRYTDAPWNITYNSNTYLALGALLSFESIEESAAIQASGVTITLSGADASILQLLDGQNLIDRQVTIYRGFLDTNNALITSPVIIFKGRTDSQQTGLDSEKGAAMVQLDCNNQFIDFERVRGRRTNDTEQQFFFPGDKGFSKVSDLVGKALVWK